MVAASSSHTGNSCPGAEFNPEVADSTSALRDIPDTLVEIPVQMYPLVITFQKFLVMLDATLGSSYLERFHQAKEGSHGNHTISSESFVRAKEVTFDRFDSQYWPRFNSEHKKQLNPSQVFTEILSRIKGGALSAGQHIDGKLSSEGYSSLRDSRTSNLTDLQRQNVYSLFQAYETLKKERGEFDLEDLVTDLHSRLKSGKYEGDQMDFVYVDEVQDLSLRQISLLRHICQNVEEGFVFAGDTAQTVARGIDFRFEDVRSFFYKEFLESKNAEKGVMSKMIQLTQNFRSHTGVLGLAQSVIDVLYHYFPQRIDLLKPETTTVAGEDPVLLEYSNNGKDIMTLFGGFGADQVILVRDDGAKTEICKRIGKQAIVLTIFEAKGLEFQDVLLFNFFGTSPLRDQWRVIYEYMKEQGLLDEKLADLSFPKFSESRHGVLCSELKQLYVAITRTRKKIWIWESKEEVSKPMFSYWKRRGLVQTRKLDDSLALAMRVASSPQEWTESGIKLFHAKLFDRAIVCFEKAGDTMWKTMAKATSIRAGADEMLGSNPKAFKDRVREAGELFDSIQEFDRAAKCYTDLGLHERAAEAYAQGDNLSACLSACRAGELFDKGLQFIKRFKGQGDGQTEQRFLEDCASHYRKRKDLNSMKKFVRAICSIESGSEFLRSIGCSDDLSVLEEGSGELLDDVELARSCEGDVLKEAGSLEKVGRTKEGAVLLLCYVFCSSLWGHGNKGWPLKQFCEKERLCEKAKSLAKSCSEDFYGYVCSELNLLSDQRSSLLELKKDLDVSQSLRGGIILTRKILDRHIRLNSSKYDWEDELPVDINKHCEDKTFRNQVSVTTLAFYWNAWKEKVLSIFKCLESFHKEDQPEGHAGQGNIESSILDYFGVRKLHGVQGNIGYMLVCEHAGWIRENAPRDRKLLTTQVIKNLFLPMMSSYWQSEFFSVGIEVLETLERLSKSKSTGSLFHQSTSLLHIYELYKGLSGCKYLNLNPKDTKKLERFLSMCRAYIDIVFPFDWRRSLSYELVSLRESDSSFNLLEGIVHHIVQQKDDIGIQKMGWVIMVCISSSKRIAHWDRIAKRIQRSSMLPFFKEFMNGTFLEASVAKALKNAISDVNTVSSMSIISYVHLLDCLLFMVSFSSRVFCTTKSSFVRWFTHVPYTSAYQAPERTVIADAICEITIAIRKILAQPQSTSSWIKRSGLNSSDCLPILTMKLIMMLSLVHLQKPEAESDYDYLLCESGCVVAEEFKDAVDRRRKDGVMVWKAEVIAEVFMSIGDPLVIVSSGNQSPGIHAPCAMFVDLGKSKEEIWSALFPVTDKASGSSSTADAKVLENPSGGRDAKSNKGKGKTNIKKKAKKK